MILVCLILASVSHISTVKPNGILDPVKNFYNKRIVEGALKAVQPALKNVIRKGIINYENETVAKAPEWLRDTLKEILDLDVQVAYTSKGIFDPLLKLLHKFFDPILHNWTQAIKVELNLTITRFEGNLLEEINTKARNTLYWRRMVKRDNWYHNQIEKLIKLISKLVDGAVGKTAEQSRDDYGNRIGKHLKDIINWFLPDDLKIDDLDFVYMKMPNKKDAQKVKDYLKNKLKEFILAVQKKIQAFIGIEFKKLSNLVSFQIEGAIRQKAKDLLPFY